MDQVAIVGAGLIGSSWALVFARAGRAVRLYDPDPAALPVALSRVDGALEMLEAHGLLGEQPASIRSRIVVTADLREAVRDALYVQENAPERTAIKAELFARLDTLADPRAILASSTSTIPVSQFTQDLPGRGRCIVAHPSTPPHVLRLVEVCPAPWTHEDTVTRTLEMQEAVGQVPTLIRKEVQGFVLNRLQVALACEAFRIWEDGIASADHIEKTVSETLGMRWSLMGPFETLSLNAPDWLADYFARFGEIMHRINTSQVARPIAPEAVAQLEAELFGDAPPDFAAKRSRRDERLLGLVAAKTARAGDGEA
jgi:L-gulonate 3-dehydrogenase